MSRWWAALLLLAACQAAVTHPVRPGPVSVEVVEAAGPLCSHQTISRAMVDGLDTSRVEVRWTVIPTLDCRLPWPALQQALDRTTADVVAVPYGSEDGAGWLDLPPGPLVLAAAGNRPGPPMNPAADVVAVTAACQGAQCLWAADGDLLAPAMVGTVWGATSGATVAAAVWAADQAARCQTIELPRAVHPALPCP
ncbi:MAG: hypothetical protein IPM45_18100 [Acidimicrobiales bacterium]|nr:hypothetical protein [Acidimicrobiales bacterium]